MWWICRKHPVVSSCNLESINTSYQWGLRFLFFQHSVLNLTFWVHSGLLGTLGVPYGNQDHMVIHHERNGTAERDGDVIKPNILYFACSVLKYLVCRVQRWGRAQTELRHHSSLDNERQSMWSLHPDSSMNKEAAPFHFCKRSLCVIVCVSVSVRWRVCVCVRPESVRDVIGLRL